MFKPIDSSKMKPRRKSNESLCLEGEFEVNHRRRKKTCTEQINYHNYGETLIKCLLTLKCVMIPGIVKPERL